MSNRPITQKQQIQQLTDDVAEIKKYLYTDNNTGTEGLVRKFDDLEKKVDEILSVIGYAKWTIGIIATIISLIVTQFINYFFK